MVKSKRTRKVIIAGSRGFTDKKFLFNRAGWWYGSLPSTPEIIVVSGGAAGADKLGEQWAKFMDFPVHHYPVLAADWEKHGAKAGMLRNVEMAKVGDVLLAFWDGVSKGTKQMINTALLHGLDVHVWQGDDTKPGPKPKSNRTVKLNRG